VKGEEKKREKGSLIKSSSMMPVHIALYGGIAAAIGIAVVITVAFLMCDVVELHNKKKV